MIKSLLNADEEPLPETKSITEETFINSPPKEDASEIQKIAEIASQIESPNVFEIPDEARFFAKPAESLRETAQTEPVVFEDETPTVEISKEELPFIRNLPANEENVPQTSAPETESFEPPFVQNLNSATENEETSSAEVSEPTIFQSNFTPETSGETIRSSGLAYTAAIVLFASIVFMMILGWFIGQLVGNSTGGIVGGIILGAIIGFVQFFRITSSIFKK